MSGGWHYNITKHSYQQNSSNFIPFPHPSTPPQLPISRPVPSFTHSHSSPIPQLHPSSPILTKPYSPTPPSSSHVYTNYRTTSKDGGVKVMMWAKLNLAVTAFSALSCACHSFGTSVIIMSSVVGCSSVVSGCACCVWHYDQALGQYFFRE